MQKLTFKSGRSLIKSDLDFLITPQELRAQLQRARHSADIINQLPSSIVSRLGKYDHKVTAPLIQQVVQTLNSGQFVALGLRKRTSPIPEGALKQLPFIEGVIGSLSDTPARLVKANYTPVTNDYVLPRVYEHTPVEPSPEHKVVVEFAGQWPANSASLLLEKTGQQPSKITKPRKDIDFTHRSIATFKDLENEPKNLYLTIPLDGTPNPLKLLLAENIEPVEKETQKDEWDNVLVPVLPSAFVDDTKDPQSTAMYTSGFFYVLWNNKVWRELEVKKNSYYSDIDIDYYRQLDEEPKTQSITDRYVDLYLYCQDTEFPLPEQPFELTREDGSVIKGKLDHNAWAHVSGLSGTQATVTFPDYCPEETPHTITVDLEKGETTLIKGRNRIAGGFPKPHIWLPYKILGEVQTELALAYSDTPLSLSEINALESNPEEVDVIYTPITGLETYSDSQTFVGDSESVFSVDECKLSDELAHDLLTNNSALYAKSQGTGVAQVTTEPPTPSACVLYYFDPEYDRSDDFIEISQIEGEWSQRKTFGEVKNSDEPIVMTFSGWPDDVDKVNVVMGRVTSPDEATPIFTDISILDLVPQAASEG